MSRRGLTPSGCFLIGAAILTITVVFSSLAGWLFYRNYSAAMRMARDEIQPVGERFIRHVSQGSFQPAYSLLTEDCRKEWPPERFAGLGEDVESKLGSLQRIHVDVWSNTLPEIVADEDQTFDSLPMSFPCKFEKGEASFHLIFRRVAREGDGKDEESVWRISGLNFEITKPDEPKK